MLNSNGATRMDVQFSVFLANKPGVLAQVCRQLANQKINITAMCLMDSTEHGVLRVVTGEADRARKVFRELNLPTTENRVMLVTLPNRPGALSDVVERLASNHISVNYAYCTTGAAGGKTVGILQVSDPARADKLITDKTARRQSDRRNLRTAPTARR
jgi:hypothetical protein